MQKYVTILYTDVELLDQLVTIQLESNQIIVCLRKDAMFIPILRHMRQNIHSYKITL